MSGRNRAFDEDKALESAAEVFWIKGFEAASTEDLLLAMNLNKGSMYNAFGNKRALFLKVFHWFAQRFTQNMKDVFKKHLNPVDAIKEIFYGVARASDPRLHVKGCFYVNILGEMSGMDEDLVKVAQQKLIDVETIFYKELKRGINEGHLAASINAKATAKYLVNLWNGLSISRRMYSCKDLEQLVETNLTIFEKSW
jgi:TetR/AcrR family transcriptional repressor of nem operon